MSKEFDWSKVPPLSAATADPAAGADVATITVPAGKIWLFLGCYCTVTNDANAGNRLPNLKIGDGTGTVKSFMSPTAITQSLSNVAISFAPGAEHAAAIANNGMVVTGIDAEGIEIMAAGTIDMDYYNIKAGDDISAMRYIYKERDA